MEEPGFAAAPGLAGTRVAIAGLGLMGGSLALALSGQCAALLGIDPDPAVLGLAAASGAFDRLSSHPEDLLPQAGLVILAAPLGAILSLLERLPELIPAPGGPVVLDLGSSKAGIAAAMQALPRRFDPLGGHPMCGKEVGGFAAAEPGLFQGRPFAFTRLERTSARACRLAEELAGVLGARPLWLDPTTHDRWASSVSHLPYLAACALASATLLEAAPLASSGFSSSTRVAATPPAMMLDVLLSNRANLLLDLHELRARLDALQAALLAADPTALQNLLEYAAAHRRQILSFGNEK